MPSGAATLHGVRMQAVHTMRSRCAASRSRGTRRIEYIYMCFMQRTKRVAITEALALSPWPHRC
jgi:hypothetical protein